MQTNNTECTGAVGIFERRCATSAFLCNALNLN